MIEFNLYHVTNGIFVNSIKKYGLGGIDPLKKFNLWSLLEELYSKSEKEIPNHPIIESYKEITNLMINQQNFKVKNPLNGKLEKHNFSHGELYLNANEQRAALFAKYHIHGSEILNRILTYLSVFEMEKIKFNYQNICQDLDLKSLMINKPNTYLIRFKTYDGLKFELEDRDDKEELDSILKDDIKLKGRIDNPNFNSRLQLKTKDVIDVKRLRFFHLKLNPEPDEILDYALIEK